MGVHPWEGGSITLGAHVHSHAWCTHLHPHPRTKLSREDGAVSTGRRGREDVYKAARPSASFRLHYVCYPNWWWWRQRWASLEVQPEATSFIPSQQLIFHCTQCAKRVSLTDTHSKLTHSQSVLWANVQGHIKIHKEKCSLYVTVMWLQIYSAPQSHQN